MLTRPVFQVSRKHAIAIATVAFVMASFFYLAPTVAAGDYRHAAILSTYGLMGLATVLVLRDWRMGIIGFSIWIVFEDLIRKSLGGALIVYFVKDMLIAITYLSYAVSGWLGRREKFNNPIAGPLLLCVGWALVQCFNPNLTSAWVPIIGLRMTFFYVPMIYLGYSYVDSEKRLRNFGLLMLSVGLLVSVGGILQSIWGLQFLNPETPAEVFRLYAARYSPVSGLEVPRISSVFVDPGRYSHYVLLLFFVGLGLLGLLYAAKERRFLSLIRFWSWICWIGASIGLYVSGQRATFIWVALTVFALLVDQALSFLRRGRGASVRTSRLLVRLGVAVALGVGVALLFFPERFTAAYHLYLESLNPARSGAEVTTRPGGYWRGTVEAFNLLGHGTGSASLGLQYISLLDPRAKIPPPAVEGGYAAVLWEWGVVGLVVWLWWTIRLLQKLWVATSKVAGSPYYMYGFSALLYTFFILFAWFFLGLQIYQNYITQAYLWFLAGVAFKLPQLARTQAESAARPRERTAKRGERGPYER